VTRSEAAFRMVGLVGSVFLRLLGRTLRLEVRGAESLRRFRREGQPVIFAFWHSGILPLAFLHRREGVVVLVSRHADGEYIVRVLARMGFETSRGSSTRGGAEGLRGLVRQVRDGRDAAITPDGPKGPARVFKPGVLVLARLTGAPVIPIRMRAHRAWRLNSWDGFLIPKPFGRLEVAYGEPCFVSRDASDEEMEACALRLSEEMNQLVGEGEGE
jgi:lysophospholipid acyltransferase (LPLAT)-like uncharacterized protein